MSITEHKLKTHKRKILTHLFPNISPCFIHMDKPIVMEIVAGRKRESHFVVICKLSDGCNRISMESAEKAVESWELFNNTTQHNNHD